MVWKNHQETMGGKSDVLKTEVLCTLESGPLNTLGFLLSKHAQICIVSIHLLDIESH